MSEPEISKCPRCGGENFAIRSLTHEGRLVHRVIECKDCIDASMSKSISEFMERSPDIAQKYAKSLLRPDFYGRVTINDDAK